MMPYLTFILFICLLTLSGYPRHNLFSAAKDDKKKKKQEKKNYEKWLHEEKGLFFARID